jgi:hypothetical protein
MKMISRSTLLAVLAAGAIAMTEQPAHAAKAIRFADLYVGDTYQVGVGMMPDIQVSEAIKGLHGSEVEILGFMDGILPRDGMHFMLIKEPSFLCPFHTTSFDWAGFLPVFLKKGTDYMDGPVRISGRLDVGRKTDEMGLVSFVRIYDARIARAD